MTSVPLQLGRKFKYSTVAPDVPSASLKRALDLLTLARLCYRVQATAANAVPLGAETKARMFKIVLLDTGLLAAMLGLGSRQALRAGHRPVFEGAMAEQVVGQLLRGLDPPFQQPQLYYWQRDKRGSEAEVDYVIARADRVVPIEVKAGKTGALRSLHSYRRLKGSDFAVRINADRPSVVVVDAAGSDRQRVAYTLLSVPFYLVEQLFRLIESAKQGSHGNGGTVRDRHPGCPSAPPCA